MNQNAGYLLLVAGFLGGAFMSSLDANTMDWPWYLLTIVVGAFGVWVVKSSARRNAQAGEVLEADRVMLQQCLNNIIANLDELNTSKDDIPPYDLRFEIDRLFRIDLLAFVEARESMKHLYSLQDYADVMSSFAAGERYINRIWSASADGYVDEAFEYLGRAHAQFIDAKICLDKARQKRASKSAMEGMAA